VVTLGGASASVGLEDAWSIGARAGLLITPHTLAYGLLAYQESDFDDAGTGLISSLSGVAVGGGLETEFSPGWRLRGEYRYVDYSGEDVLGIADLDTSEHSFRAGLVWKFH
jgi:opacity protein-like surface antigen